MKREQTILSAFLFAEYNRCPDETPEYFKLDVPLFSTPLMRRIANKINETVEAGESLDLLSIELEEKLKGTTYENEWLEIMAAHPLPIRLAKALHDRLQKERLCALI